MFQHAQTPNYVQQL